MSASPLSSVAYLLVFHGSRDVRPSQAMERLAQFVRSQLETKALEPASPAPRLTRGAVMAASQSQFERLPAAVTDAGGQGKSQRSTWPLAAHPLLVGTACLEAGALPLSQQIINFGQRAAAAGVQTIRIIPIFLLQGVHVVQDLPEAVQVAQRSLAHLTLTVSAPLGSHPGLKNLVQQKLQSTESDAWLLLAHGSRRAESNGAIQTLAKSLGGVTAFWSVPPSLEKQVIHLIQRGVQRVAILPYFLFSGTTTDTIIHRTEELAERFPSMGFHLLPPLGPSSELAQLVVDLALGRVSSKPPSTAVSLKRMAFRPVAQPSSLVS